MSNEKESGQKPENTIGSSLTAAVEEGPYYKSGSPERTQLCEEGVPGINLTLSGYVYDTAGNPVPHAWLDFWQANGEGVYDNSGYTLRGHQYTDESGHYSLKTVVPGAYEVRTPHIHVKVRALDTSPLLTTQLFIPGLSSNKNDFLYRDDLLINMKDAPSGKEAVFNFTVES